MLEKNADSGLQKTVEANSISDFPSYLVKNIPLWLLLLEVMGVYDSYELYVLFILDNECCDHKKTNGDSLPVDVTEGDRGTNP